MNKELSKKLRFLDDKPRLKSLFLFLFRSEGYVTSELLAEKLSVTSRTIKSDIKELGENLKDIGTIEAKRAHGYRLVIENDRIGEQIKAAFQIFQTSRVENIKDTYMLYMLRRLMTSGSGLRIEDFQSELLTTNSLTNELKEVKNMLGKYGLELHSRPKHGMMVVGPEFKKMMLTIRIYRYFDIYTQTNSGVLEYDELFRCSTEDKQHIRKVILASIIKSRIVFSDLNLERFILYLIFCRNHAASRTLDLSEINFAVSETDEYKLVVEILNKLSSILPGFEFSSDYITFLSYIAIMSTDLYRFSDCSYDTYKELIGIAQEGRNFLLKEMSEYLQIDFLDDYTCFKDTLKIMLPISLKMLLQVSDSIDMRYKDYTSSSYHPILRYFVTKLSQQFLIKYGYEFSDREQDVLFTTFLGVLNRVNLDIKKLNIAIIAIDGRLSTQQLKFNLKHYFNDFIEKIDTKTLYELNFSESKKYDYYLCSKIGKNLSISHQPIYFVKDDISEFNYEDSFRQIFFESYCYDDILPKIQLFQAEAPDDLRGEIVDVEVGDIKIRFSLSLTSAKERMIVYNQLKNQYIVTVEVDVKDRPQKLKMLMNVLNSIVERVDLLSHSSVSYRDLLN